MSYHQLAGFDQQAELMPEARSIGSILNGLREVATLRASARLRHPQLRRSLALRGKLA
jgi:hypothetical protein